MRKNLTIFCDDDSLQYQFERQIQTAKHQRKSPSPLSKNGKSFNLIHNQTTCQTPKSIQYPRESFEFKSQKYAGIIQKNILQRLEFYDKKHKQKQQTKELSIRIKEDQLRNKQIRQKPQINQISKNLFQKVKKERKLSPNILERFQTYECQRSSRNAKYELLKTFGMDIKQSKSTCKKNMNQKNRSPLKQTNHNKQISRSKSKSLLKKTIKQSQNIGKIYRISKEHQTYKKQHKFATSSSEIPNQDLFTSLTPRGKPNFQKKNQFYRQKMNEQQLIFKNNTKPIVNRILNKDKPLSPICQRRPTGPKWKVIT